MKYCEKCGIKLEDEVIICPQCQTPTTNQIPKIQNPQIPTKEKFSMNKSHKTNVIIVIILIINIMFSATNTYLILFNDNNGSVSDISNDTNNISSSNTNKSCPANEYGNHIWAPATCREPAKCNKCGVSKDDKLGTHDWFNFEDGRACWDCGLPYEEYSNSQK